MFSYEVKINYDKMTEDGPGRVRETYLVDAMSCAEAETKVIEHVKPNVFGECETPSVKKRIFFVVFPNAEAENWYEAKVEQMVVDGDKETRRAVTMLVQEDTIFGAVKELKFKLANLDFEIIGIKKSAIIELL